MPDDKPLAKMIAEIVTRPMAATEITVAVPEAGYQTAVSKASLCSRIAWILRRDGFVRDGERWAKG